MAWGDFGVMYPSAELSEFSSGTSRRLTEKAITDITRNLLDVDGVVLTNEIPTDTTNFYFEFILLGYYFKVKYSELIKVISNWKTLYVGIKLHETTGDIVYTELLVDDSNKEHLGLYFGNDILTDCNISIKILEKDDEDNVKIPDDSRIKFVPDSVKGLFDIKHITCGTI